MKCKHCGGRCVKNGIQRDVQRFRCKGCGREQQLDYKYLACCASTNAEIISLVKEGVGIRSISRILRISISAVINRIKRVATMIQKTCQPTENSIYEIDELRTYIGKKSNEVWITCSFDRSTSSVIDFVIGPRTKEQLAFVTSSVLASSPLRICTDGDIITLWSTVNWSNG